MMAVPALPRHSRKNGSGELRLNAQELQVKTRKVGLIDPHYGLEKVSYAMKIPGYEYRKVKRVSMHRLDRKGSFWAYTPILWDRSVDLVHTFNMLPMNARRFVMSCEMELPRYLGVVQSWQQRMGHRLLASNSCRAILALSDIACRQGREKFESLGFPQISEKIQTFRGTISAPEAFVARDRDSREPIRLLFVGRNALRKGIVPTINAIQILRDGGVDVRLTLVTTLDVSDDYVFDSATSSIPELRSRIESSPWIMHIDRASNEAVRRWMGEHDAFVMPTFDESLGWVIVEAGMDGCPVITTDVFAIPELVDDGASGRLLSLPKNSSQRWPGLFLRGDEKRDCIAEATNSLTGQLVSALDSICRDRSVLNRWGQCARAKMMSMFDRDQATMRLQQIYDDACD